MVSEQFIKFKIAVTIIEDFNKNLNLFSNETLNYLFYKTIL